MEPRVTLARRGATAAGELHAFVRRSLLDPAASDRADDAPVRRRVVVALTSLIGALALGAALAIRPGDALFYPATIGVAVVWAVGALASGRLALGRSRSRNGRPGRAVVQGLVCGGALLLVFLAGALVVAQVPVLRGPVDGLLDHARYGSLAIVASVTALNGIAEEMFFRGATYAALPPRWRIAGSTAWYAASTLVSGVPLLTFAAVCLGLLTAFQRRATGGILGPIVSHLTWSLGMLVCLPPLLSLV